jgi:hypothetical protein
MIAGTRFTLNPQPSAAHSIPSESSGPPAEMSGQNVKCEDLIPLFPKGLQQPVKIYRVKDLKQGSYTAP